MQDPGKYEEFKSFSRRSIDDILPAIIDNMSPWASQELVLDYGCGAGTTAAKFFVPLAEETDSFIEGVDSSGEMIEYAKKNSPNPRVTYIQADVLGNGEALKGKVYDKIFCIHVFHFIRDFRAALQSFYDLSRPGTEVGIMFPTNKCFYEIQKALSVVAELAPYAQGLERKFPMWHAESASPSLVLSKFEESAKNIGFHMCHAQVHYQENLLSFDVVVEFFMAVTPFHKKVPQKLLEKYRSMYKEIIAYVYDVPIDATRFLMPHEFITIVMRK